MAQRWLKCLMRLKTKGSAVKKREDVHRMAEANKSFRSLPLVS
jgi:ribosomal protein S7